MTSSDSPENTAATNTLAFRMSCQRRIYSSVTSGCETEPFMGQPPAGEVAAGVVIGAGTADGSGMFPRTLEGGAGEESEIILAAQMMR